jgi:tetratricopeptide (TPR) repeat protein
LRFRAAPVPVILALVAFLTFSSAFRAPFVYEDHTLFQNPAVTLPNGWYLSFHPEQPHPLTWFSFWLNHAVAGRDPFWWHVINLALHITACVLLWSVISKLLPREQAIVAAFVFALHPIQTEPVMYVSARGTLLAAVFCLLSLRWWIAGRHWAAVASFGFALLAREEAAAFPALLWMLHLAGRSDPAERAPLAAVPFAAAPIRVMFALGLAAGLRAAVLAWGSYRAEPALDYLATQGLVILRYFRLLAVPVGFSIDPNISVAEPWQGVAAWAAIVASVAVALWRFRRGGEGLWYLAGLALLIPASCLFPAADLAADRWLYLPMIAFSTLAALLLRRSTIPMLLAAGAITYGMLSYSRSVVWTSEAELWEDALRQAPGKIHPRLELARVLPAERGLDLLREAKRIAPDDPRVASELGNLHLRQSHASLALGEFGRAVALAPGDAQARNNRGVALMAVGFRDHAIIDFEKALELDPCLFDAHRNLRRLGRAAAIPRKCTFNPEQLRELN